MPGKNLFGGQYNFFFAAAFEASLVKRVYCPEWHLLKMSSPPNAEHLAGILMQVESAFSKIPACAGMTRYSLGKCRCMLFPEFARRRVQSPHPRADALTLSPGSSLAQHRRGGRMAQQMSAP